MVRRVFVGLALGLALAAGAADVDVKPLSFRGPGEVLPTDRNAIGRVVTARRDDVWYAQVEYNYTGEPAGATLHFLQGNEKSAVKGPRDQTSPKPVAATRGASIATIRLVRPPEDSFDWTRSVTFELRGPDGKDVLTSKTLGGLNVEWPSAARRAAAEPSSLPAAPVTPADQRSNITAMEMRRLRDGSWMVTVDYYYSGDPSGSQLRIARKDRSDSSGKPPEVSRLPMQLLQVGAQRRVISLPRPAGGQNVTLEVTPELVGGDGRVYAQRATATRIEWPSAQMVALEAEIGSKTPEEIVAQAVLLIDEGRRSGVEKARSYLEYAVRLEPRLDTAYIEMARVSMKLNRGPEGLHQAERFLDSAIGIRDSINARILLAYVYAYQKRFSESQALLAAAAKQNPPNLWLWTNWGEMEELRGNADQAIRHHRETIARPVTNDTYDLARMHSYYKLLRLLEQKNDLDGMDKLHRQRLDEYGNRECAGVEYARFLASRKGDAPRAIALVRHAMEGECNGQRARETLGLAHYVAWGAAPQAQRSALNEARIYLPVSARLFYELAQTDRTMALARQLIAAGEKVDMPDNTKWNALSFALQAQELQVASRLIELGARPDLPMGEQQLPVAFLPVFLKHEAGIRLMQRAGIDYHKLKHEGVTAIEMARSAGERELVRLLEQSGT